MVKTESFPKKFRTGQECPLLPLLFNTVLKILDTAIKGIKYIQIIREEVRQMIRRKSGTQTLAF